MISPSMRFLDVGKFLHAQNERERITLAHMLQTSSVMLGGDDQDLSDHGGRVLLVGDFLSPLSQYQ